MRIAALILGTSLLAAAGCGGKSKSTQPATGSSLENSGGEGGNAYGSSTGGYEDDKEPCDEEGSE